MINSMKELTLAFDIGRPLESSLISTVDVIISEVQSQNLETNLNNLKIDVMGTKSLYVTMQ